MSSFLTLWTAALLTVFATPTAPPGEAVGSVTGFQVLPIRLHTEVVISLDAQVEARHFTMEGPSRVVIDLVGARFASAQGITEQVARGGLQTIRASQYSQDVVRVVLEVDGPLDYTVQTGGSWVRVALANPTGVDFEPWSSLPLDEARTAALLAGNLGPVASTATPAIAFPSSQVIAARTSTLGTTRVQEGDPIWISFQNTPIRDVAFAFADHADRSIVVGSGVDLNISAEIKGEPWDIALSGILDAYGLIAREQATGIIQIQRAQFLTAQEEFEPFVTQVFRVNFSNAEDLIPTLETMRTTRGQIAFNASTNTITVTDLRRVVQAVDELLKGVDIQTPEITIAARIMFVNRTDLAEFGVTYDLKDSFGNQLNQLTPGGRDLNGDGVIDFNPDADPVEIVERGTDVISLGGSSIAALGNANQRVISPSLQFLTSLVLGRRTLVSFVEALQSVNLSDVQASPLIRVLDNVPARTQVGERTPLRVADYGAQGGGGGQGGGNNVPQITTELVETGIILEVTPHLAAGDLVWMDVYVERSGVEQLELGPQFNTQNARSRVLAADGETVVIGGLTVTETTEVRAGIPILQDLPLIGRLFRNTRNQTVQRDLMILLTPQINQR